MAANCTGKICKCYDNVILQPDETLPPLSLIIVAVVHLYLVVVFGTLCNSVAIWCVVTCKKTRTPVKVLLCSVFVPLLVICLVTRTMRAQMMFALLDCDPEKAPVPYRMITMLLYSFLAQVELACITALAIVRVVAVWSSKRHAIRLRVAVIVVISIVIYSFFSGVGILGSIWMDYVQPEDLQRVLYIIYFFINVMLPFIVTAIAYALMLYAMRRNRQRLAVSESRTSTAGTLDQATRAMIAVFISNLVFGFPHAVYHLVGFTRITELVFHMLFYTHFVVDPLVFVWYNTNYRQRVQKRVRAAWVLTFGCCKSPSFNDSIRSISSTLPLWRSSPSSDQSSSDSADPRGIQLAGTVFTKV